MLTRFFLLLSILSQPFSYSVNDLRRDYDAAPALHPMFPLGGDAPFAYPGSPPYNPEYYGGVPEYYGGAPEYYGGVPYPHEDYGYEYESKSPRRQKDSSRRRKKTEQKQRIYAQFEEEALEDSDNAKYLAGLIRANFWQLESEGGEFGGIRSAIIQCVKDDIESNENAQILLRLTRSINDAFLRKILPTETLYYFMNEDLIAVLPRPAADGQTMRNRLIPTADGQAAMAILEGFVWNCAERQAELAEGVGQKRTTEFRRNPI